MAGFAHLVKISCSEIQEGVAFAAPVYFDDGENMFLGARRPVKKYHIDALKRWNIPFLMASGIKLRLSAREPSGEKKE